MPIHRQVADISSCFSPTKSSSFKEPRSPKQTVSTPKKLAISTTPTTPSSTLPSPRSQNSNYAVPLSPRYMQPTASSNQRVERITAQRDAIAKHQTSSTPTTPRSARDLNASFNAADEDAVSKPSTPSRNASYMKPTVASTNRILLSRLQSLSSILMPSVQAGDEQYLH